jgi:hypothetical protein
MRICSWNTFFLVMHNKFWPILYSNNVVLSANQMLLPLDKISYELLQFILFYRPDLAAMVDKRDLTSLSDVFGVAIP